VCVTMRLGGSAHGVCVCVHKPVEVGQCAVFGVCDCEIVCVRCVYV
jgi:hypothetical protein